MLSKFFFFFWRKFFIHWKNFLSSIFFSWKPKKILKIWRVYGDYRVAQTVHFWIILFTNRINFCWMATWKKINWTRSWQRRFSETSLETVVTRGYRRWTIFNDVKHFNWETHKMLFVSSSPINSPTFLSIFKTVSH